MGTTATAAQRIRRGYQVRTLRYRSRLEDRLRAEISSVAQSRVWVDSHLQANSNRRRSQHAVPGQNVCGEAAPCLGHDAQSLARRQGVPAATRAFVWQAVQVECSFAFASLGGVPRVLARRARRPADGRLCGSSDACRATLFRPAVEDPVRGPRFPARELGRCGGVVADPGAGSAPPGS